MHPEKRIIVNNWSSLRQFTPARIALGRTGVSLPLHEVLHFKMAHAHARDAVFSLLDKDMIIEQLSSLHVPVIALQSCAADKQFYLQRPDLGRRLDRASRQLLSGNQTSSYDISISLTDGLSAEAINRHAIPVITMLLESFATRKLSVAPLCLIEGGRVAIGDETGSLLNARLSLILIGERPGLSSPDSMGAYLTFAPQVGFTDERRNCVSNIRPEGLSYKEAAAKIDYLVGEAFRLQLSGVDLKDNAGADLQVLSQEGYDA